VREIRSDQVAALPAQLAAELEARREGIRPDARVRRGRGALVRRALVSADFAALFLAFLTTALIFGPGVGRQNHLALGAEYLLFLLTLPLWALGAKLYELYDRDEELTEHSTLDEFVAVLHLVTIGAWLLYLGVHITGLAHPELAKVGIFWALALIFVTAGRGAARTYCRRQPEYVQNTLIVGAGEVGQLVARKFQQHAEYGINLVGFVDDRPLELRSDLDGERVLGSADEIERIVQEHAVQRVVIAFSNESTAETVALVRLLKRLDVQIDIVPRLFDAVGPNVTVHSVEGLPLLGLPSSKLLPYSRGIKRAFDLVGTSLLLLCTAPIFGFIAWRVHRDSPGPVFFRQKRLGEGMREFSALKFRTMFVDTDDAAHREFIKQTMTAAAAPTANGLYKLERTDAITRTGRWLRRTSLDELPNLINVFRGEMSLVGPRPCIRYELESFQPHHFERFLVPAGITGLWQVTARAHATFGEALDMDVAYARNWSLGLDLWLLLRTPFKVFCKSTTR
jgi:exopolysaccharide biosynthesis polyprenyl glycosylphosphotransferase